MAQINYVNITLHQNLGLLDSYRKLIRRRNAKTLGRGMDS
jgi:hypothetical protein